MKFLVSILIVFLAVSAGFAQNKQNLKKANEKVEELKQQLVAINPELTLTKAQEDLIREVHLQKMEDIKLINQSEEAEEVKDQKRKEIYKNSSKKINNEILTKEQRKALNEAKSKEKSSGNE